MRLERRQLRVLVPLRPRVRRPRQCFAAVLALLGVEVDDVVDPLWRNRFSSGSAMTRLTTPPSLALVALPGALPAHARRVARRRQIRVSRVPAQALRQLRDLPHERLDARLQLHDARRLPRLRRDLRILRGDLGLQLGYAALALQRPT